MGAAIAVVGRILVDVKGFSVRVLFGLIKRDSIVLVGHRIGRKLPRIEVHPVS